MDDFITCNYIMNCTGRLIKKDKVLRNKEIFVYFFSSSTCVQGKLLLSRLRDIYNEAKKRHLAMEIFYISSDTDPEIMLKHFKQYHHGWYAIPINEPTIRELQIQYNVTFEPQIIVVNKEGALVTKKGTADIELLGLNVIIKWITPPII